MMVTIGRYEIVRRLGIGGMAEVFLCRQHGISGFDKLVVLKQIRSDIDNPELVEMFLDEARVAANLSHTNIVQIFEVGETEGRPYIVMEYIAGPQLSGMLQRLRGAPEHRHLGHLALLLSGAAEGLHYAHNARDADGNALQIVHRDVSPHNILVSPDGTPKLFDFGVAKATSNCAMTNAGAIKGKIAYMAPEQLRAHPIDHKADIFATGVCLYEATVGRRPWPGDTEAEVFGARLDGSFPRPSVLVPGYPPELEKIVVDAMSIDPDRRPDASRLAAALSSFARTRGSTTKTMMSWISGLLPEPRRPHSTTGGRASFVPVSFHDRASLTTMPIAGSSRASPVRRALVIGSAVISVLGIAAGLYLVRAPATHDAPAPATAVVASNAPTMLAVELAPVEPAPVEPAPVEPPPVVEAPPVVKPPPRPSAVAKPAPAMRSNGRLAPASHARTTAPVRPSPPSAEAAPPPAEPEVKEVPVEAPPSPPPPPPKPTIDVAATRSAVMTQLGPIQQCYERARMDDMNLRGSVTTRITVASDGSIASVKIASSTLGSHQVEDCVTREVARWHLPRPSNGPVSFSYPFSFQ